jgi:hypothetical protein
MNPPRIRFGTHARILRANGWLSIIPVRPDKVPAIAGWSGHGLTPPSDQLIETWRPEYPDCGIGYVMDGNVAAFDADISIDRFLKLGFTIKDAERAARDLAAEIKVLAVKTLGPADFVRVGLAPKFMLFYAAIDTIPTMAGSAVEVFCGPATKQVLLYGFHAEAVDKYRWVGARQPLTHSIDDLPAVASEQAVEFRAEALALCDQAGLRAQPRIQTANGGGARVSSGIVGDYMTEVLTLIGKNWHQDPGEVAVDYFRQSVDGERHYRVVAICGPLILRHFTDDEIIAALAPAYAAIVHDNPSLSRLKVCPARLRRGMRALGTNVATLAELDAWLGAEWSICHA